MLTGKYDVGHEFVWPDIRNRFLPEERDAMLKLGKELEEMLPAGYEYPAQLAAAFGLADPAVSGIILGGQKQRPS